MDQTAERQALARCLKRPSFTSDDYAQVLTAIDPRCDGLRYLAQMITRGVVTEGEDGTLTAGPRRWKVLNRGHKTVLRSAVEWLTSLEMPWTFGELEQLAHEYDPRAVRRYVGALLGQRVLRLATATTYERGAAHATWLATVPFTHPGGRSRDYQRRRQARDALRSKAWQYARDAQRAANQGAQSAYLTVAEAAARIGVSPSTLTDKDESWGILRYASKDAAPRTLYLAADITAFICGQRQG